MCDTGKYNPSKIEGLVKVADIPYLPNLKKPPDINFKVKSIPFGFLVRLGCGREIVFQDKTGLIDVINAYINDPEKIEKEFNLD